LNVDEITKYKKELDNNIQLSSSNNPKIKIDELNKSIEILTETLFKILGIIETYKPNDIEFYKTKIIDLRAKFESTKDNIKMIINNKILESTEYSVLKSSQQIIMDKSIKDLINTSDYTIKEIDRKINLYNLSKLFIPNENEIQISEKNFSDIDNINDDNNSNFIFLVLRKYLEN